jgi:hypothetical protein
MEGGGTGVTGVWARCEKSGRGRSGGTGGAGCPSGGRVGSAGKGCRGPVSTGDPGSRTGGALGTGGAGCVTVCLAAGAVGTGRRGTDRDRFTKPGAAGVEGDANGGWMAPPGPLPPIGGRNGRKLGVAGFSCSGGVSPTTTAAGGGATVCGGVTLLPTGGFVAGGRGMTGALRVGNVGRASSLNVVRIGGLND